jgi:drug/metabolite transporter (DMT)-like permease
MNRHLLGQVYSLLAALTWAGALVLFKQSVEKVPPLALNLFKNGVGLVLLAVTLLVQLDGPLALSGFPLADFGILAVSGVLGIALADTVLFHSLNLIGVGLLSIVDCLYTPFVILLSAVLLSEKLAAAQYCGAGLILMGVIVSSRHEPPRDRTRAQLVIGVLLGALAMALIALGIVLAKPVLDGGFPVLWATVVRMAAGTVALAGMAAASPQRRQYWSVFRPAAVWKTSIPAAVLGSYLSMILWIAGFKLTYASVAGILNQTTIIFALVLATVVLKERFTTRKLVSVVLAVGGVVVVILAGVP